MEMVPIQICGDVEHDARSMDLDSNSEIIPNTPESVTNQPRTPELTGFTSDNSNSCEIPLQSNLISRLPVMDDFISDYRHTDDIHEDEKFNHHYPQQYHHQPQQIQGQQDYANEEQYHAHQRSHLESNANSFNMELDTLSVATVNYNLNMNNSSQFNGIANENHNHHMDSDSNSSFIQP